MRTESLIWCILKEQQKIDKEKDYYTTLIKELEKENTSLLINLDNSQKINIKETNSIKNKTAVQKANIISHKHGKSLNIIH